MIIEKNVNHSSKIRRYPTEKNIHYLFIFNKSGICLYGKNFTDNYKLMDKQLLSGFFTAIRAFTKEVMGTNIKTIEMGKVKFVLIKEEEYYYGVLCDSIENLLLIEGIISKINLRFLEYINKNNLKVDIEYVQDKDLNRLIDSIVDDILSTEFDVEKEKEIIEHLEFLSKNDEISGAILLTDKGKVIFSTIDRTYLKSFLKEVEFRVKICNNSILKLFYTNRNKQLIFSEYVENQYFIILVFDSETKFGMAQFYLEKAVKIIKSKLYDEDFKHITSKII